MSKIIKIKDLDGLGKAIQQLDLSKESVKSAIEQLGNNIQVAENKTNVAQLRSSLEEVKIELRKIELVEKAKKLEQEILNTELDIEPVKITGKYNILDGVKEQLLGLIL